MSTFKWSLGVDQAYAKAQRNGTARGDVQRHLQRHGTVSSSWIR